MSKRCKLCGEVLKTNNHYIRQIYSSEEELTHFYYCSEECIKDDMYNNYEIEHIGYECRSCGKILDKEYTIDKFDNRFCSKDCFKKYHEIKEYYYNCTQCKRTYYTGAPYKDSHGNQFCSRTCIGIHYNTIVITEEL
jgi:hypothetical protein